MSINIGAPYPLLHLDKSDRFWYDLINKIMAAAGK